MDKYCNEGECYLVLTFKASTNFCTYPPLRWIKSEPEVNWDMAFPHLSRTLPWLANVMPALAKNIRMKLQGTIGRPSGWVDTNTSFHNLCLPSYLPGLVHSFCPSGNWTASRFSSTLIKISTSYKQMYTQRITTYLHARGTCSREAPLSSMNCAMSSWVDLSTS